MCSQPRRLAARELAARVTKEFGCKVGEEIYYADGFVTLLNMLCLF